MSRACRACGIPLVAGARWCHACGTATDGRRRARTWPLALAGGALALIIVAIVAASVAIEMTGTSDVRRARALAHVATHIPGVMTLYTYDHDGLLTGQGSGFVVDRRGTAVTNFHVIEDAWRAEATLGDGRLYQVLRVESFDPDLDLAVFRLGRTFEGKVEWPDSLHALTVGSLSDVGVGDPVAIISSPRGLENTVTDGLVSGVRDEDDGRVLQISAPISPGSSGGPVFDRRGDVVGIATRQVTEGQNLNFALAADSLARLLAERHELTLPQFQESLATGYNSPARKGWRRAFAKAWDLYDDEHYDDALHWYLEAEKLWPDDASPYYNAALCWVALGRRDEAARQYRLFLHRAPADDPYLERARDWLARNGFAGGEKRGAR
jgi:S1-C subfamily serine protease